VHGPESANGYQQQSGVDFPPDGQLGIVRQHRANPHQNRIMLSPQLVRHPHRLQPADRQPFSPLGGDTSV
jgi:hypothetical protein